MSLALADGVKRRHVVAAVLGNALEVYDFASYAYFAVMIGNAFFPSQNATLSLLLSLATFGVGFVSRPLGGILIGAYGDRAGRRAAMMLSFVLMGIGSAALGLTPSYESIGLAAPAIIIVARLIQGFAFGGEVGPATAFLIEAARPESRGFFGALQFSSQGLSTLVAGIVGVTLASLLSDAQMQDWGWRIPFLLGTLILPLGFIIRRSLPETLHHEPVPGEKAGGDFTSLMRDHGRVVLLGLVMIASTTIPFYIINYMTTYAIVTLHMPAAISLSATVMFGACNLLFSAPGGWLSDRIGRKPLMIWPRLAQVVLAYPAFMLLTEYPSALTLLSVTALLAFLNQPSGAVGLAAVGEALPRQGRSTALGSIYAIAVAIFGGSTQFMIAFLIARTGDPLAPGWYMAGATAIGLIAIFAMKETAPARLARQPV